jgi:hypothetical protein
MLSRTCVQSGSSFGLEHDPLVCAEQTLLGEERQGVFPRSPYETGNPARDLR